jgi:hypothetical protein
MSVSRGLMSISHYSSWASTLYYSFELDVANSLEFAFLGWRDSVYSLRSPKHILSVFSEDYTASIAGSRSREHIPCTLTVYNAGGLRTHELGYECIPSIVDQYRASPAYQKGNFLYYLIKYREDGNQSDIFRYDIAQDTITQINGADEFEAILSVSRNNKYLVVLMDDNDLIDFPWQDPQFCCEGDTHGRHLAILDIESGQILYRSEPVGVYKASDVIWTDDENVVISASLVYGDDYSDWSGGYLLRISFEENYYTAYITNQYGGIALEPSPDQQYGLSETHVLIDLQTLETIPFLSPSLPEDYAVLTRWQEDGRLRVLVRVKDDYSQQVTYMVTLSEQIEVGEDS